MIGRTLSHFKITAKLGKGGMGEVFVAEDTNLKRRVALKVLPADLAGSQERLERFQREAESLSTPRPLPSLTRDAILPLPPPTNSGPDNAYP